MIENRKHRCPVPGCWRDVFAQFWGCSAHWLLIPQELRKEWIQSRRRDLDVQPVEHQAASEKIRNWVSENAGKLGAKPPRVETESTSTPVVESDFSAGLTTDDDLLLFWPLSGEYIIIERKHARVVKNVLLRRTPVTWEP